MKTLFPIPLPPRSAAAPILLAALASLAVPQAGAQDAPAKSAAESDDTEAPAIEASRFVGPEQRKAYLEALSSILLMREREIDPFGQFQDPEARPIARPVISESRRRPAQPQTFPFEEIINRIVVNTVMPGEGKFLLGTQVYGVGERINLNFRMRTIPVEIVSVSSGSIEFRNTENGDTASLKIYVMPAGMTPGNKAIQTPGMVRQRKDAPIDLDSAFPSDDSSANR